MRGKIGSQGHTQVVYDGDGDDDDDVDDGGDDDGTMGEARGRVKSERARL